MDLQVVECLGRGSFGVVYLMRTNKPPFTFYAVKSAPLELSGSLVKELRVLEEFSGSSRIVPCYGGLNFGNSYGIKLQYASCGTLEDMMVKFGGKLPDRDVFRFTRMILEGLACIHAQGYVHCDLKPANILVFPYVDPNTGITSTEIKIADFGLAKEPHEVTDPALWKHRFRGCIIVQMLTGELGWPYRKGEDIRYKLVRGFELPPIAADLSNLATLFVGRCLSRNPGERWTAEMLLCHPIWLTQLNRDSTFVRPTITETLYFPPWQPLALA